MRRLSVLLIVSLLAAVTHAPAQTPTPPYSFHGVRELVNVARGDTLLPEFSYIPSDTALKLFGNRLAVRADGIPVIFLRIYKVSRNPDGSIKSKVMLSADTVSIRVGNSCAAPWILTRSGECAGDTTRVPVVRDTTKLPPPGDTTKAPPTTTASTQPSAARSASMPMSLFSAPAPVQKRPDRAKTFRQMLEADPELRTEYAKHPEIAPRHMDEPLGVDNQINPRTLGLPPDLKYQNPRSAKPEKVLPLSMGREMARSEKVIPVTKR